jgi:hypothetical protein
MISFMAPTTPRACIGRGDGNGVGRVRSLQHDQGSSGGRKTALSWWAFRGLYGRLSRILVLSRLCNPPGYGYAPLRFVLDVHVVLRLVWPRGGMSQCLASKRSSRARRFVG